MKYVIALGGNAIIGNSYEKQLESIREATKSLAGLMADTENKIAITYGNGPQVGNILIQNSAAKRLSPENPMHVCVAQTQGSIGSMIQTSLYGLLKEKGINREISAISTFVEVNQNDPAFQNYTKPIGPFYNKLETRELLCQKSNGNVYKKISEKTWRRVVPSPEPLRILNSGAIKKIFEFGDIPIVCGGGGIPCIINNNKIIGMDAVIDKDKASALLAEILGADIFIILTTEAKVSLNYKKHNQKPLSEMNINEAEKYLSEDHFSEGSMKPKVEAAIRFVKNNDDRKTLITDFSCLPDALNHKNGTWIYNKNGEEK